MEPESHTLISWLKKEDAMTAIHMGEEVTDGSLNHVDLLMEASLPGEEEN